MSIRNKVMVNLMLEKGLSQKEGEVERSWSPINFSIYSDLFLDMINEAIDEWLSDNVMTPDYTYEIIFAHVIESDYGSVISEHFEPVMVETREL